MLADVLDNFKSLHPLFPRRLAGARSRSPKSFPSVGSTSPPRASTLDAPDDFLLAFLYQRPTQILSHTKRDISRSCRVPAFSATSTSTAAALLAMRPPTSSRHQRFPSVARAPPPHATTAFPLQIQLLSLGRLPIFHPPSSLSSIILPAHIDRSTLVDGAHTRRAASLDTPLAERFIGDLDRSSAGEAGALRRGTAHGLTHLRRVTARAATGRREGDVRLRSILVE
ncbi:hypothetical protein C8R47DRAFT_1313691 [Mycena vitilis]|nr:hypothetical protein C8R47DRAFT_1313691 [Mycena vitilis]